MALRAGSWCKLGVADCCSRKRVRLFPARFLHSRLLAFSVSQTPERARYSSVPGDGYLAAAFRVVLSVQMYMHESFGFLFLVDKARKQASPVD